MKKLVLFVEGEGDKLAIPLLVKRLITDLGLWDHFQLDPNPFEIGGVAAVLGTEKKVERWLRLVSAATKRPNVGSYKPSKDQAALTEIVDLNVIRSCGLRSFKRLETALHQLAEACKTGHHVSTPT
jgi:hypothetical protein